MKVGIIAGAGSLPIIAAEVFHKQNIETVALTPVNSTFDRISPLVGKVFMVSIGTVRKNIKLLKKEKVTHVLMIGKFDKTVLDGGLKFDLLALWTLFWLKDRTHDSIHKAIMNLLKKNGMETMEQSEVLKDATVAEGIFTKAKPTKAQLEDVAFGYTAMLAVGKYADGQTVVIKKKCVMALESAEGTDATIIRGCRLAKEGAVVVKGTKINQDDRYDLPTVGITTFQNIVVNNGKMLAIEAHKTLVVDFDECVKYADKNGIVFMAFEPEKFNNPDLFE